MFHVIPGARLGPYQLVSSLGAGGMGEVFKATDTRLDRAVAIKVLPSHLASDADAKSRFEREAKAIAALNHPNICTLHDIGHHDGTDFLVMELVEGETLATRLARGALPLDQAVTIATEMAEALDKAHRAGIIHRDLKPANIMLTKSGAKLLDFGLAKLAPQQAAVTGSSTVATQSPVTGAGTILGSLNYMSPEQVEGREVDHRSDIFSFGCVLYEMVTGKRAFDGASAASVMAAILERVPVFTAGENLPEGIEWIVRRCLRKAPDERCQSARDLADELQWVGSSPRPAANGRYWTSSRAALISAVCAALLTAVTAVAIFATRRGASPPPARTVAFQVHPPEGTFLPEAAPNAILAVAPDESAVAFSVSTTAGPAIAVRWLDGASVILSGTAGGDNAFWSPDGQFIAFVADGELRKVSVRGGRPVTLASGATRAGGTWSAQGGIIFPGERGLMRTTASGGAVTPVTQIEHDGDRHMYPQFLADGESFIFLELRTRGQAPSRATGGDITLVSPAGKRVLVASRSRALVAAGALLFVQSGSLLAQSFDEARGVLQGEPWHVMPQVITDVAANNNGSAAFAAAGRHLLVYRLAPMLQQLVWADRTGQSIARAGSPRSDYTNPRLSPDGGEIVLEQHEPKTFAGDLWRLDQRGLLTRVTSNGDRDHNSLPMWAADGRSVVFSRGTQILRKSAANDGDEKVLASGSRLIRLADGSTDGRYLIYDEVSSSGRRDIFYVTLPDGTEPRAYLQSVYDEGGGRLSKDAKWFAYTSDDTGKIEVYVDTFPIRTRKMRVSSDGGHSPRWRADGRELFYMSSDRVIMSVIFEPGAAISTPVARRLFPTTVGISNGQANYDVSGDGQRFILSPSSESDTMHALLNWSQARQ